MKNIENQLVKINLKRVKFFRDKLELSETQLAKKAGIDRNTLINALSGKNFTVKTWLGISRALGCNPVDIIIVEGFPPPIDENPLSQNVIQLLPMDKPVLIKFDGMAMLTAESGDDDQVVYKISARPPSKE